MDNHEGEPKTENSAVDVESLIQRLEQLESTNERLLNDSKGYKNKYQSLKNELETKEKVSLEEKNDFKGLYERANGEVQKLKDELGQTKKNSLKTALKYEVSKNATDAQDVDLLLSALQSKKEGIAYDSESGSWRGVDDVIGELRQEKPFLFRKDRVGMENGRPSNNPPKEKSVSERINEDPSGVLSDALADFLG